MAKKELDANGGTFGWKYPANKSEPDPETSVFFYIALSLLAAIFILTTLVFALMDAEWSFWHWGVMGVLGVIPAIFTVLLGIGFVADRLR